MKTSIHVHSENSRYDSAMNVKTLCEKAKEKGYDAVTLTDHGTLTGIDDFIMAAREVGIKPIPGVEAYVQEDEGDYKRFHLILIAKDDLGYQGIGKAVTRSNKRIDVKGFPRMNKEILTELFGPGKKYHDHVIATSACIGGVLGGILLSPLDFQKDIIKLERNLNKYESPESESYQFNLNNFKNETDRKAELVELKETYRALSKKPYKKKEKALEKLKKTATEEEYKEAYEALEAEKKESAEAAQKLEEIITQISVISKRISDIKSKIKEQEESHVKYNKILEQIDQLRKKQIPIEKLYSITVDEAKWYDETFGHGNFYIEMQYHGFKAEDGVTEIEPFVMEQLIKIADELNIPMVAANDAHMPDGSESSIRARQIICSLRYATDGNVAETRDGDENLYIKSEEELRNTMKKVLPENRIDEVFENTNKIGEECNCTFETTPHYPKYLGLKEGETADSALKKLTIECIYKKYTDSNGKLKGWTRKHKERVEYELSVIASMGYSDYFLIVQDFLEIGRKLGRLSKEDLDYLTEHVKEMSLQEFLDYIDSHMTEVGFTVGLGRGSAAGSLVAYLVGITNVEPLKYDLLFERFLNKDRVSMPEKISGIQCEPHYSRVCL